MKSNEKATSFALLRFLVYVSVMAKHPALLRISLSLTLVLLAGCSIAPIANFSLRGPRFEPEKYFAGHTVSSGVFENRAGNPGRQFKTDARGHLEGETLVLSQTFAYQDGEIQKRRWRIRRVAAHRYEATANDVIGIAKGEARGSVFRFAYTLAVKPDNPFFNVRLNQTMALQKDGTVLNRATISKFGITIATVKEKFRRVE